MCFSNRNCKHSQALKEPKWGGPGWQTGLETSGWFWAAWLLREELDSETWQLACDVAAAEADLLKKEIPSRVKGNTGAEDCIWNAAMMGAAANFLEGDPRSASWDEWCKRWALNALSREPDRRSRQVVDGKPLSQWLNSTNVHPDLTLENHGFWSIPYQAEYGQICEAILAYHLRGQKVPEALTLHNPELWKDVLEWLALCDGDLLCPQGQDWAPRDIQQIWIYALMSAYHKYPSAINTEVRALRLLTARQAAFGDGSIHANNFGYETHLARHWSISLLMHQQFGPVASPPKQGAAEVANSGAKVFPYVKVAVFRAPATVSSVSWAESRQTVVVVPNETQGTDPASPFTDYDPRSGLGWIRLQGSTKPVEFRRTTEPKIVQNKEALAVSFQRIDLGRVKQDVGYVALGSGEVVVFSRWTALADLQVAETVSHPFYWLKIDKFLPERTALEKAPACWSIGDKLQVRVIGGAGGRSENHALLGSVQDKPRSYKRHDVIESSVAIYQPIGTDRSLAAAHGDTSEVTVGAVTIRWQSNGTLTVESKSD
jgi:hypothetical protein